LIKKRKNTDTWPALKEAWFGDKERAIATLLVDSQQQHKDNLKDVDDCVLLSKIGDFYIHLIPNNSGEHFKPLWQGYQPIGIEKI
jgi:hypothetical protein